MLNFENLSTLEFEDDDDILNEGMNSDQTGLDTPNESEEEKGDLCNVCFLRDKNCALIPCGHYYFCMECYNAYKTTDNTMFNMLPYMNDTDFDNASIELAQERAQPIKCPYCQEVATGVLELRRT